MSITQIFFTIIRQGWKNDPSIREQALEGLAYAASVLENWQK